MNKFKLLCESQVHSFTVGKEQTPIIVIDDFYPKPQELIDLAFEQEGGDKYQAQSGDFYPGVRKRSPTFYNEGVAEVLLPFLASSYSSQRFKELKTTLSAFSITTTLPQNLRPIQTLPHFDTVAGHQFAVIHYLCSDKHGGTSFYRHKTTNFERISSDKFIAYGQLLKQQAVAEKLHLDLRYITGDHKLFERIHSVEAKMNRAVIYPSNLLHSGDIRPEHGLYDNPSQGRLTISSFVIAS